MTADHTGRPLRLSDVIILMVAIAAGLALAKQPFLKLHPLHVKGKAFVDYFLYFSLVYPAITPLTFAVPILTLRRSRPHRRTCLRRPGAAGCVAAASSLILFGVRYVPEFWRCDHWLFGPIHHWLEVSPTVGHVVLATWVTQAVVGDWRPEHDGLDRVGIALGVLWIVAPLLNIVAHWVAWLQEIGILHCS
jgi:hypothetical protein